MGQGFKLLARGLTMEPKAIEHDAIRLSFLKLGDPNSRQCFWRHL